MVLTVGVEDSDGADTRPDCRLKYAEVIISLFVICHVQLFTFFHPPTLFNYRMLYFTESA